MNNAKERLISPCGVYCGDCPAHRAGDDPAMMKRMLDLGFSADVLPCPGCRAIEGKCLVIGGTCDTYRCVDEKGVTYCYECAEFPCDRFIPAVDKASHAVQNLKVFNLCYIQKHGIESWLAAYADIKKRYFSGTLVYGKGPQV